MTQVTTWESDKITILAHLAYRANGNKLWYIAQ